MRRGWIIAGSIVGAIVLIVITVFIYAALNLNSIIQANRERIIAKVSDSLGRKFKVANIRASLGWGVAMDLMGVTIADDPAFSNRPMLAAQEIFCSVELIPLLSKDLRITSLAISSPELRIERSAAGAMNFSTIGKQPGGSNPAGPAAPRPDQGGTSAAPHAAAPGGKIKGSPMETAPPRTESGPSALEALYVRSFSITNGTIYYLDSARGDRPLVVKDVDLDVNDFRADAPFKVKLALAAFSDSQNFQVNGKAGPLMQQGAFDFKNLPLELGIGVGPVGLAEIRALQGLGKAIPEKLSIDGPVSATGKVSGRLDSTRFELSSDLGSDHIIYAGLFDKAAGVPLSLAAAGSRNAGKIHVDQANLTLAGLKLKAGDVSFGGGKLGARLDSNRFDLGQLAQTIAVLAQYKASGKAELHANAALAQGKPNIKGTLTLAGVGLSPGGKAPALADLSGDLRMAGNSAEIGPLAFKLGSGKAQLAARARSIQPIDATYTLNVDRLRPAELVPSRAEAGPEEIRALKVSGTVTGSSAAPAIVTTVTSPSGMVNNITYTNLDLAANYADKVLAVKSLKLAAFSGSLAATARVEFATARKFNLTADLNNINVQQALEAQKSSAANIVRGLVTGNVRVSGAGANFDQIKPTLAGNGKVAIQKGKLVGVNVVATALNKVTNIPAIGALIPSGVVSRHPELFKNRDTDIDQASLTFVMQGPRITSHDLTVKSTDYSVVGDGWFDLDKRIDMAAHILLTRQLSNEIRAEKKNVVYLENPNGEVDIPLRVSGELPKPVVAPDVVQLAQRAGSQAIRQKGEKALGKFLEKKGLGGFLGGGSGGGAAPQATPAPSNPLAPFKKLF